MKAWVLVILGVCAAFTAAGCTIDADDDDGDRVIERETVVVPQEHDHDDADNKTEVHVNP